MRIINAGSLAQVWHTIYTTSIPEVSTMIQQRLEGRIKRNVAQDKMRM
jgi:hypothetical protein